MSKGPGADWAFSDCFQKLYTYSPRQAQSSRGGRIRSQTLRRNPGPTATGYISLATSPCFQSVLDAIPHVRYRFLSGFELGFCSYL